MSIVRRVAWAGLKYFLILDIKENFDDVFSATLALYTLFMH